MIFLIPTITKLQKQLIIRKTVTSCQYIFLKKMHQQSTVAVHSENEKKVTPFGWLLLLIPITTFGLGCWQVKRKSWKENLIKELEQKKLLPPVNLPENLEELKKMEYKKVTVRGKYQYDKELYIGPRSFIRPDGVEKIGGLFSQKDTSNGYLVITPFKLSDRDDVILINRGWISRNEKNYKNMKNEQKNDEIKVTGVVRLAEKRPQFTPDHKGDIYFYRDLEKMCKQTGASPYFLDAVYNPSISGPIGGQTRVTLRNEHLSYIITWFGLSGATSFLWYRQIIKGIPF